MTPVILAFGKVEVEVQGHPWPHSRVPGQPGYMRLFLLPPPQKAESVKNILISLAVCFKSTGQFQKEAEV